MAAPRTPARRRQRSVRVTVSVVLLSVATVGVLLALPTQSPVLLSVSAVAALAFGWAALRIMWTELLQSRREHAADRAATANAYKSLFSQRAAEHAEFTTAMTERLAESNISVRELQSELVLAQKQLAKSQRQTADAHERAKSAEETVGKIRDRMTELERSIDVLRAERESEDALASWEAEGGEPERGSVDELISWEAKAAQIKAEQDEMTRAVKRA